MSANSAGSAGDFAGTAGLVRLAVRRDRVLTPVWLVVLAVTAASSASATAGLYPTAAARADAAAGFNRSPALVAMYGRIYDTTSLGALAMLKLTVLGALCVGILTAFIVVRHTRAEEETGRLELVRAGVVGRLAPLTAALLVAVAASLLLGALTAAVLAAAGLPSGGSVAFGLTWACAGVAFAAVAGVAAQLTEGARAARGIAVLALGVSYLLRMIGDTATGARAGYSGWASWLSPLGWAEQIRPFAGNRWALALLPLAFAVVVGVLAFVLIGRRDVAAGLLRARLGPAGATPRLRTPLALAWRLHRAALAGWLVAFVLLGVVLGSIAADVGSLLDSAQSRDFIRDLGGTGSLTDAFLAAELGFVGVFASAYGISAATRLRSEEAAGRAEPLLATAVGRHRWLAGHVAVALLGTAALVAGTGLGAGLTRGAATGDVLGDMADLLGAALVRLPAVWVLTGVTVALFGLAPRLVVAGWAVLAAFLLIGELGPVLGLPAAVLDVSPYTHVPRLPGEAWSTAPLCWLLAVAAALLAAGFVGFARRDLDAGG